MRSKIVKFFILRGNAFVVWKVNGNHSVKLQGARFYRFLLCYCMPHFCPIKFQSYVKKYLLNHRLPRGSWLFRFGWNYIFVEFGVCAVNGNHLVKLYFVDAKFACGLVVVFLRPKFPPYVSCSGYFDISNVVFLSCRSEHGGLDY